MILQGVRENIAKHLDDAAMEVYLAAKRLDEIKFEFESGQQNTRTFLSWQICPDGSYVQGEVDQKGNYDGRVIKIIPKD